MEESTRFSCTVPDIATEIHHAQHRLHRRRIEADGRTNLRIPEFRKIDRRIPRLLHETSPSIRAFHGDLKSSAPENQRLGITRNGLWRGAARKGNLRARVHHVLGERSHGRVGGLWSLALHRNPPLSTAATIAETIAFDPTGCIVLSW